MAGGEVSHPYIVKAKANHQPVFMNAGLTYMLLLKGCSYMNLLNIIYHNAKQINETMIEMIIIQFLHKQLTGTAYYTQ